MMTFIYCSMLESGGSTNTTIAGSRWSNSTSSFMKGNHPSTIPSILAQLSLSLMYTTGPRMDLRKMYPERSGTKEQ